VSLLEKTGRQEPVILFMEDLGEIQTTYIGLLLMILKTA